MKIIFETYDDNWVGYGDMISQTMFLDDINEFHYLLGKFQVESIQRKLLEFVVFVRNTKKTWPITGEFVVSKLDGSVFKIE